MRRTALALLFLLALARSLPGAEERAIYRASGEDARLFDQYDNDGYSLAVTPAVDGSLELTVRVSDAPLSSAAPFPTGQPRDSALPPASDRDAFARRLVEESRTQEEAVRRLLLGLAAEVTYDRDRLRLQDPSAVFASRRAYCVGLAELAVDLLRRVGISARTVQGVLACGPACDGFDTAVGGAYHRWIDVYYPDRGYVFSDPSSSVNGVDARYIPFRVRSLVKPHSLAVTTVSASGELSYRLVHAGDTTVRVRAAR
jgi:transglutaminase-like putative cysteine protease